MAHRCHALLPLALSIVVLTPALKLSFAQTHESASNDASSNSLLSAAKRLSSAYGKLPLSFEQNEGQTDGSVQFLARQAGYTLFLAPGEAVLSLHAAPPGAIKPELPVAGKQPAALLTDTVRMQLIGADIKAQAAGVDPLPGKSNYFIGNDPAKWHTDVPTYAKVRYQNIYPGIDLVYYGNQEGRLEHDFVVSPGADPNAIELSMRDSEGTVAPEDGGLTLHARAGDFTLRSPVVYQEIKGERKTIPATYTLTGNNQIGFKLGSYDRTAPLVIDPVIQYSGRFGGSGDDVGAAIAVDSAHNAYVTGQAASLDFPLVNAFQSHPNGTVSAFVAKINVSGTALVYSTYLACTATGISTNTFGIAVDGAGRAFVAGATGAGFPVKNAHQSVNGGGRDAFLTVFSPAGNSLVYSTYLGGPGDDSANAIALDASANAYITGASGSGFPTLHSVQPKGDSFVAKFNSTGTLQYSSILTAAVAIPLGIAVDASGSAYITGGTLSTSYPTVHPFQSKCRACPASPNGFVTKLSPSGESLVYSTYLGGPSLTQGEAIAVDTSGQAYIAGVTGGGFPVTGNAFQKSFGGGSFDVFITKLNATGSGLVYSTYLGGSGSDLIAGMALDQYRQVYVTGTTASRNFPQKAPIQIFTGATSDGFVTTLSNTGRSILYYSTYFGPSDDTRGIAVDKALNVYLTGQMLPGEIPITPGAIDISGGSYDVFVSKLVIMDDLSLALSASPSPVKHGGTLTYTIAVTSKGPDFATNVRVTDALPAGTTFVSDSAGGGSCTAPAVGHSGTLQCTLAQLNKGSTYTVKLTVRVNAASGSTLSNTATAVSNTQDFTPANNKGTITTRVN